MKKPIFRSIFIIILSILSVTFVIKSVFSNRLFEDNNDEFEDIENAIIIKGIEHISNTPLDDFYISSHGVIIYNNSFNDLNSGKKIIEIAEADNKTNSGYRNSKVTDNICNNVIRQLRSEDSKWHLTAHKIMKRENLWFIAKEYRTDYKLIIKANNIKNPDMLNPGNTIQIPNRKGLDHKIKKNETISEIAKLYNVSQDTIIANNKIKKDLIVAGDTIFIPDAVNKRKPVKSRIKLKYDQPVDDEELYAKRDNPIKFIRPLKGKISSAFGKRIDPISKRSKFHCGLDISAPVGTPVKASAKGKCIFSGWKKGYGRVVILKHAKGYITVYAHNKENKITAGEKVSKGSIIALSGISGAVTGPHLHFEIRKYVTPLNPVRFIK